MSIDMDLTLKKKLHIDAPVSEVWDAITDPEKVKKYFFNTQVETDWKQGSPIFFSGDYEGQKYRDIGRILNVEKERWVQYSYYSSFSGLPDEPENYSIVSYKLEGSDGATELTVEQRGFASEEAAGHAETGWERVLKGLKALVE